MVFGSRVRNGTFGGGFSPLNLWWQAWWAEAVFEKLLP